MVNWKNIRSQFPIFSRKVNGKPLAYLDNAATSQKPRVVLDAMTDFYENRNANVHRGRHTLSDEASDLFDAAHEKAARLVGASTMSEIVMTKNATEGINLVGNSLERKKFFKKGDEIVLSGMEHHANLVPWVLLANRLGLKIKVIPVLANGELDYEKAASLISNKTRLVAVTHVSNVLGTINDVKQLSGLAKDAGALSLVDGCQSVPHLPVNVKKIGCDFLVWSSHKMCGPMGVGGLFGRQELLEEMPPFLTGGEMISEVFWDHVSFNRLPWKFEAGTPDVAGVIGFGAAIDFLQKIGLQEIQSHDQELGKNAFSKLRQVGNVELLGSPSVSKRVPLFSFVVKGVHSHDVSTVLDSQGIAIRSGNHCAQPLLRDLGFESVCRASFYLYNTENEVDRLVDGIKKTQTIFGVAR